MRSGQRPPGGRHGQPPIPSIGCRHGVCPGERQAQHVQVRPDRDEIFTDPSARRPRFSAGRVTDRARRRHRIREGDLGTNPLTTESRAAFRLGLSRRVDGCAAEGVARPVSFEVSVTLGERPTAAMQLAFARRVVGPNQTAGPSGGPAAVGREGVQRMAAPSHGRRRGPWCPL